MAKNYFWARKYELDVTRNPEQLKIYPKNVFILCALTTIYKQICMNNFF